MKRIEAYFILNELWKDANEKQREAISIAQNDIEFVDLMPEEVAKRLKGDETNADYIRGMSDEELCDFIVFHTGYRESAWSQTTYYNFLTGRDDTRANADTDTMKWLKQPFKEKEE